MRRVKPQVAGGQIQLRFETPRIPGEYDEAMARNAALRRFRRVGALALNKQKTAGFRSKTMGLWVPYSAAENTSVVTPPDAQLIRDRIATKQRVRTQLSQTDKDEAETEDIARWASRKIFRERRAKFRQYYEQSAQHLIGLQGALRPDRTYDTESIFDARWALHWMSEYVIALKGFNEHKWLQKHWVRKREEARREAGEYIRGLPDQELLDFYDEAVWNTWSRKLYWQPIVFRRDNTDPTQDLASQYPIELSAPPPEDY